MLTQRITRRAVGLLAATLGVLLISSQSSAEANCRAVTGHYREHDDSGPGCTSPVGLCIAGEYRGDIKGTFSGEATSIVASADTPVTSTLFFTSDSRIVAKLGGRVGTLVVKNAGAFHTSPDGAIVDVQTIVGGTDGFAGASGALRSEGTFTQASGGESSYDGTVCVP
jgi:hypothetical protein